MIDIAKRMRYHTQKLKYRFQIVNATISKFHGGKHKEGTLINIMLEKNTEKGVPKICGSLPQNVPAHLGVLFKLLS
jgi:hypothetical protein